MIRKVFTMAVVMIAAGGAFVGSTSAQTLLLAQTQGWHDSLTGDTISTSAAISDCPNQTDTECAYHVGSNGEPDNQFRYNKLD